MALKYEVENLDGIDEQIAKLYVEKDGKFYLDVTGHEKNEQDRIPKSRLDQEISKRKVVEKALNLIAEKLKADVPEEYQNLVPDLPSDKLIDWLQNASTKGLFDEKQATNIDSKRPSDKKPQDFSNMSPQAIMATGYKT